MNLTRISIAVLAAVVAAPTFGQAAEPLESIAARTPSLGSNVQLGTDTDVEAIALDWDRANGRLFAALRRATGDVRVYSSIDGGATWGGSDPFPGAEQMDAVVQGGWFYVVYSQGGVVTLRRFSTASGAPDEAYGGTGHYQIVDFSPATVREIALAGNATDDNTAFHMFLLMSNHAVVNYYGSGTTFNYGGLTCGDGDADSGLAAAWNIGYPSVPSASFIIFSYVSTADEVRYCRFVNGYGWTSGTVQSGATSAEETSISEYHSSVIIGYEHPNGFGTDDAKYAINHAAGYDVWVTSSLGQATSAAESYHAPLVTTASGTGIAALLPRALGAVDDLALRDRHHYAGGEAWAPGVPVNDHAPRYPVEPQPLDLAFEWMGSGWATAYVDSDGAAWFTWSSEIRYAGFLSGNLSEWSSSVGGGL